jgi:putative transcription antitermination factor YqgF
MDTIKPTTKDTVLAIDFGTVRIGLAISRYTLAEPLKIIANDDKMFSNIQEICVSENVKKIVVGVSENEMAVLTKKFAGELEGEIADNWENKPTIEFMDETLSSHSVHQKLKTAKKSKRGADIDHLAAAEFLQEWLEENY